MVLNFEWAGGPRKAALRPLPMALKRAGRIALAAAIGTYCILSIIAGPAGLIAYGRLVERKAAMEANLAALAAANGELRSEIESLSGDADRAAREARSLGYLAAGEVEVVLDGWTSPSAVIDTGEVLPLIQPTALPDESIKGISLGVFLATLALTVTPRKKDRR